MERGSTGVALQQIRRLYTLGALGGLSDSRLLELFLIRDGASDEDAFAELVHRHGPMVLGVCRRALPTPHDAEDAFQATFLILARRAASIGRPERLASWLHGVAIRTASEARRRAARRRRRERRMMDESRRQRPAPDERSEAIALLDEELDRLPRRYRDALVACELEGRSRRDAARQLEIPEGTLSTHLARGRKLLHDRLVRRGVALGLAPHAGLSWPAAPAALPETLLGSTVRVVVGDAAKGMATPAVPTAVSSLAGGVLRMMFVTRLSLLLTSLVSAGLTGLAAVAWAANSGAPRPNPTAPVARTPAERPAATPPRAGDDMPRMRLRGVVVDESGKPVPTITVRVSNALDRQTRSVTDETGRFEILVGTPPYLDTMLLAASPDRTRQGQAEPRADQPVRIVLKPARRLTVRVADRSGTPLRGASVAFLSARNVIADGMSDADGRWTVLVPADAAAWTVFARMSGLGFDYAVAGRPNFPYVVSRRPGAPVEPDTLPLPDHLTLKLDGARTQRVKAVDARGKPVPGVRIGVWTYHKPEPGAGDFFNTPALNAELWPRTGEDGMVVLDWLPRRIERAMGLGPTAEGFEAMLPTWIVVAEPVDPLTVTMLPVQILSGRVTYPDGRPAAGITVQAAGSGPDRSGVNRSATTDAEGRYRMRVLAEQSYVVAVEDRVWAAPYRKGIFVGSGESVDGVDFVLGTGTRLHGRITVGRAERPLAGASVRAAIQGEQVPPDRRLSSFSYDSPSTLALWTQTDADGRYEFRLGPGEYRIDNLPRVGPVTVTIPAASPPAEITRDLRLPREETGPFVAEVVDAANRPVAGARLEGRYPSSRATRGWFGIEKTDDAGRLRTTRALDLLLLHVESPDGRRAAMARIDPEATHARIVIGPLATASGRLVDPDGKLLAGKTLEYGIEIHVDELRSNAFTTAFGGTVKTDERGRFLLERLMPGQTYQVSLAMTGRSWRPATQVTPKGPGPLDLGDVEVDPVADRPSVPPTPEKRAAEAFKARKSTPPAERLKELIAEARREHTRPLLLFGGPSDVACTELFRAFHDEPGQGGAGNDNASKAPPAPSALRWDFELAAFDVDRPGVRELLAKLGPGTGRPAPPVLVVLDDASSFLSRHPLRPDRGGRLDRHELGAYLASQKAPPRDVARMLAEALAKARAEERRVFLVLSASWCPPCRRFARFLDEQKTELERHYVIVQPDVSRDRGVEALRGRFPESKDSGIPWFAILDADDKVLCTSNVTASDGPGDPPTVRNIGYPDARWRLEHFARILAQTAPRISAEAIDGLCRAAANLE